MAVCYVAGEISDLALFPGMPSGCAHHNLGLANMLLLWPQLRCPFLQQEAACEGSLLQACRVAMLISEQDWNVSDTVSR